MVENGWMSVICRKGAFSEDPEVRRETFLDEMEIYTLLGEIGGMIGTPVIDVDLLQKRSPDKKILNAYSQGKLQLKKIIEMPKL